MPSEARTPTTSQTIALTPNNALDFEPLRPWGNTAEARRPVQAVASLLLWEKRLLPVPWLGSVRLATITPRGVMAIERIRIRHLILLQKCIGIDRRVSGVIKDCQPCQPLAEP